MSIALEELAGRLGDPTLAIIDVRSADEYRGRSGYPCDPRQGHIPRAAHLPWEELYAAAGQPRSAEAIRATLRDRGVDPGAELVVYCHSGQRSELAAVALRSAGLSVSNYDGSWHEWARHPELPAEQGEV